MVRAQTLQKLRSGWILLAAALMMPLLAQIGQYPPGGSPGQYPPGQYPPGQYPPRQGGSGPGGGISLPHRGKKKAAEKKKDAIPNFNQDGWVVSSTSSELQIGTDDGRLIKLKVDADTKFTKEGNPGSAAQASENAFVHVEAFEDDQWYLTAATVDLRKDPGRKAAAGGPEQPPSGPAQPPATTKSASAAAPQDNSGAVPSPDAMGAPPEDVPGRPILHHGKPTGKDTSPDEDMTPKPQKASKSTSTSQASADGSIDFTVGDEKAEVKRKPSSYSDLIAQTRTWSEEFSKGLPNFVCEQVTTRYQENSRAEGFQPLDVVSAKVIYEDGKEDYQQIMVGGKRTNKSMMELGGSTSTGEFGVHAAQSVFRLCGCGV